MAPIITALAVAIFSLPSLSGYAATLPGANPGLPPPGAPSKPHPASEPDSSAGTTFSNCTGNIAFPPTSSSSDTLPQVNLDSVPTGWETWELALVSQTDSSLLLLTWSHGVPDGSSQNPTASFHISGSLGNGTSFSTNATDAGLTTKDDGTIKQIAVSGNTLTWDDSLTWYNVSFSLNGYSGNVQNQALPPVPFSPSVGGIKGQISTGLFSEVVVPRGSVSGVLQLASAETIGATTVSTLVHNWAFEPVQNSVTEYTRGTSWISDETASLSVSWLTATGRQGESQSNDAASISNAKPSILYDQATNDPSVFQLTQSYDATSDDGAYAVDLTIAGCSATADQPISWNTSTVAKLRSFSDDAGGVMTHYLISVTANYPLYGLGLPDTNSTAPSSGVPAGASKAPGDVPTSTTGIPASSTSVNVTSSKASKRAILLGKTSQAASGFGIFVVYEGAKARTGTPSSTPPEGPPDVPDGFGLPGSLPFLGGAGLDSPSSNPGFPSLPSAGLPAGAFLPAPSLGLPPAPSLGFPPAPSLGFSPAPSFGLPAAPSSVPGGFDGGLSGTEGAPTNEVPGPSGLFPFLPFGAVP